MSWAEPFLTEVGLARRRPGRAGAVVMAHSKEALSGIHERDTAMVIAERSLPSGLEEWLGAWARHAPEVDTWVDRTTDLSFVAAGLPPGALRATFLADLGEIRDTFLRVAESPRCRFVAGPVRNDSCRKFHVDHIRLRLVTTYVGPGTDWAPESAVDFAALDHPEACDCQAPPSLVHSPSEVKRAKAGDLLLMKGELYANDVRGQVHRSPPIEGTGLTRYVVVLTLPGRFS